MGRTRVRSHWRRRRGEPTLTEILLACVVFLFIFAMFVSEAGT